MTNEGRIINQAEDALRRSELRFRTLVGAASVITWSCPASGLHVEPQPEWMAFTGQTAEDMLGDGWSRAIHPEDLELVASAWSTATARGEPYSNNHRIRRHDGEWRWMSVRAAPIPNEDGEIVEWFGMCVDITEQKRAMEALQESEERFRLFMDNSPAIAWMKDEEGRLVYYNKTFERRFGAQPCWLGRSDSELWPPEVAAEFRRNDLAVVATGRPIEVVEDTREPDGSRCYWLSTKFPFRDAAGKRYVGGIGLDSADRARMETALRASERRFRAIFNLQFEYSGLVDSDLRIIELSESIHRGTGVPVEAAIGRPFLEGPWWRDVPETRARWQAQFEEALAQPGASRGEVEYRTSSGETGTVLSAVTALRDEEGKLESFLVEGIDITDRKRAENALRESEDRLRRVLNTADVGLVRCSRDWIYLSANPAYAKIVGKPLDQIIGHSLLEVMGAKAVETIRPYVERVLRGEQVIYESQIAYDAAGQRYAHVSITPESDASGQVVGWVASITDITDRKRTEDALRESEERLRRVSNNADVGLVRCSRDWIYLSANPAYANMVGKPLDQIIGRPLPEVMGAKAVETIRPYVERTLRGEHIVYESQVPYEGAGERYLRLSTTPDYDAPGQIVGWVASITDITDRRAIEEALRLADRRKNEFLAMLAHELRGPLGPISSGLEILQQGSIDSAEAQRAFDMMTRQANHVVRLVDDLLEVSRVNQGLIELRKERTDLAQAVQDGIAAAQPLIAGFGHHLTVSLPSEPLLLDADPTRLVQIATNLITNACKFTEPNGRIEISARAENGCALMCVRDNGIGLPPDQLEHVFDSFKRIDGACEQSRRGRGLGLGLALVRKLVELHDGYIAAVSEGLGRGSEFIVRLPLPDERLVTNPVPEDAAIRTITPRILVVDDNRDVADSLALLLETLDTTVRVAYSGQSALPIAATFKPDVVFLDIMMPGMDGYETAGRLRRLPGGPNILLIALTGLSQEKHRRRSLEAGFDEHLRKPIDFEKLQELVDSRRNTNTSPHPVSRRAQ